MKNAQKPDYLSLNGLISRLREGRYVIPDFQRDFEWNPWDIRELMRSIFLDYYIGSLLLWKGKQENFDALACEPIYGFEGKSDPTHIVLDGQQRLTAIYYAFIAPDIRAPSRTNRFLFFIRVDLFMQETYDKAFEYDWTRRGVNLLSDQGWQFESHMFPLSIMGKDGWDLPNWIQGYEKHWRDRERDLRENGDDEEKAGIALKHAENATGFGEHLRGITQEYQISYIELDRDLEIDKVCDIFTQINSRGIRLDVFDLINALLKPKGIQLKHLWRDAAPRLEFIESERLNVYVLQVISILRQAYCSPKYLYFLLPGQERQIREPGGSLRKEVLVPDIEDFKKRWLDAVDALDRAIQVLRHPQEYGAISSQYVPYVSILPAFAALQKAANMLPEGRRLDAHRKVRHWYWASVFNVRYSGSVESTTARDFLDVKAWFDDDAAEPGLIREFHSQFRSLDLRRETKRGSSIYNGIFNLLIVRGARDWIQGYVAQSGDLDDHHIVPKSWGKEQGLGNRIHTILNRTPLTAETNRKFISDRLPNAYLPELIAKNGEKVVRGTLESHFISPPAFEILLRDPFAVEDYEAFLAERQRTLTTAIEDLLVKERIDLSPPLRDLDAQAEKIELKLRTLIDQALSEDKDRLPEHILQKTRERLQSATRQNPVMDQDGYETLAGRLEFADLRDLQDAIVDKALWPKFQNTFRNKENLGTRFDQLAGLRSSIRHSRTVDDVTRKDGEAAVLWFDQVLGKAIG